MKLLILLGTHGAHTIFNTCSFTPDTTRSQLYLGARTLQRAMGKMLEEKLLSASGWDMSGTSTSTQTWPIGWLLASQKTVPDHFDLNQKLQMASLVSDCIAISFQYPRVLSVTTVWPWCTSQLHPWSHFDGFAHPAMPWGGIAARCMCRGIANGCAKLEDLTCCIKML